LALAAIGGALVYGRFGVPQSLPLPDAVEGDRRVLQGRSGPLSYYVAGQGAPLLLIHSINAAGSAYEVSPLFHALKGERRVYAVDLPGFGFSDRSDRRYDIRLFVTAIGDMLDAIAADTGVVPDVLALSLSAEFLARAAVERPGRMRSLCFVTPTGFETGSSARRKPEGSSREVRGLATAVSGPGWGRSLYNLLVTRPSIRFFLEKTWGSKRIDEGMFEYSYLTSHQPGAQNAPFAFVSGRLFSADIRNVYEALKLPVLVLHGTKGDFSDYAEIGWTRARPNWRVESFDTGALVYFEQLDAFLEAYTSFLDHPPG
jgi:pimeloyl-ACP methyl ester carboxylesterase